MLNNSHRVLERLSLAHTGTDELQDVFSLRRIRGPDGQDITALLAKLMLPDDGVVT